MQPWEVNKQQKQKGTIMKCIYEHVDWSGRGGLMTLEMKLWDDSWAEYLRLVGLQLL